MFAIKARSFNRHRLNLFLACSDFEVTIILSRVLAKFTFSLIINFSTVEIRYIHFIERR